MFELVSSLFKYVFIAIIYIFIYSIIRLIILDIRAMSEKGKPKAACAHFLKFAGIREHMGFRVEDNYALTGDTSIGRAKENGICIDDSYLSAVNSILIKKRKAFYLKDNFSTNGTMLNGKRLGKKPVRLKNGDRIHVGSLDFIYINAGRQGE